MMAGEARAAITQPVPAYDLRLSVNFSSEGDVFKDKT